MHIKHPCEKCFYIKWHYHKDMTMVEEKLLIKTNFG
jgi:hypothetical protein